MIQQINQNQTKRHMNGCRPWKIIGVSMEKGGNVLKINMGYAIAIKN